MKSVVAVALVLLLLCFLCPLLLLPQGDCSAEEPTHLVPSPTVAEAEEPVSQLDSQTQVRVLLADDSVVTLSMADYLWRVVAAEMPASFEPDALSAQATTARTYTLYRMVNGSTRHEGADICTDSSCCQAYLDPSQAVASWGEDAAWYSQKIADAIADTDGQVILYQGEPIDALFFSSVAGSTLDAVEVWGTEVPYLSAVDSPEGEEVPSYSTQQQVPLAQFQEAILLAYPDADLSGDASGWLGEVTYSSNGGIAQLELGGVTVTGTSLRTLFSLRSTHFTLTLDDEMAIFSVTGYGHGVGMSQYGANALAKEGYSWQEILYWYYQGVAIEVYKGQ